MRVPVILLSPALLSACAAAAPPGAVPHNPAGGTCREGAASRFIGQRVSTDLGAQVLEASGAQSLRWGTVGGAMTMDYNEGRVNVIYDADMLVERITCG